MITNFDEPFHVKAKIDMQLLELLITPVYNKINTDAAYTVTYNGKILGKLKRHNIKSWEWVDSKMEQATANEIGLKIDTHYS